MNTKIDPYSGEEFLPTRKNQIFANTKNKIAFNNNKAAKIREERAPINNIIKRNYEILKLLLDNRSEKTVNLNTLNDLSFKANHYLKHEYINNKHIFTIYNINFQSIKKDNINYLKIIKS